MDSVYKMVVHYREIAPPVRLAPYVECCWSLHVDELQRAYRVLPDGCIDILFSRPGGLSVVGPMTRPHRFDLPAGQFLLGVRFRPGMSCQFVRAPGRMLTDRQVPLREFWGAAAGALDARLEAADSAEECLAILNGQLDTQPSAGSMEKAISWMVHNRGLVRIDDVAEQSGWSARQFRRLCLDQTGLTPKQLCRVIRFRNALGQVRRRSGDWASLALDCGYYDQSHFINEFREFSGVSPGQYTAE